MVLKHLQGAVCIASTALLVALQAGAQQRVEEMTVVGARGAGQMYEALYRQISIDDYCHSINHSQPWCPQYQGREGDREMPNYGSNDQECNGTDEVTPHCRCGSDAPHKVYDVSAGKFYCRTNPPTGPCSTWDHAFSYDPKKWKCETRQFDDDAEDAAKRLKNCMGSGVVAKHWHRLEKLLVYDTSLPGAGQAPCSMVGGNPVPSAIKINPDRIDRIASQWGVSPWQLLADVLIHESYHLEDYFQYNYCLEMWTQFGYALMLRRNNHTADWPGMEEYTDSRTYDEYRSQFGVVSPGDRKNYRHSAHGKLSCPLE